jgi:hypothetical protein
LSISIGDETMNLDDLIEKASKRAGEFERNPPDWLYIGIFLGVVGGIAAMNAIF